jgi:tyrosyl-tRNA synthetase
MSTRIVEELQWRGLLQDISDLEGFKKLNSEDCFYVGYDPTAPSLQLGNLVPIIVSLRLAKGGLKAIQLFGGATGAIGDPSGKNTERPLLERTMIDANIANHTRIVRGIFERVEVQAEFVNNYEWTEKLCVLEFLRDVGKHFSINYLLAKEVIKSRLDGEGISFTEFSYMLLQAYDFLYLFSNKNCRLQIGGSDQWGNITAGLELIRRKVGGEAYALSFPLITDSRGKKFSKSESGTIWLDGKATSPYRFHQFWLNVDDADVVKYLKVFTFHDQAVIENMEEVTKAAPEKRQAQRLLADSVCTLVHGEEATRDAKKCAEVLFGGPLEGVSDTQLGDIFSDAPASTMARSELAEITFLDALVKTRLVPSKSEGRRLVAGGGAYINNQRITDADIRLADSSFGSLKMLVLRAGKKNYHLMRIV